MLLRSFRAQCILRVGFMLVTISAIVWLTAIKELYFSGFFILLLLAVQTFDLIRFVENTNRRLTRFLESIRNEDFSQQFPHDGKGHSFEQLSEAMNAVIQKFSAARKSREEAFQYLHIIFEKSPVAMLLLDKQHSVRMVNKTFLKLVGTSTFIKLEDLLDRSEALYHALNQREALNQVRLPGKEGMLDLSIRKSGFSIFGEELQLISIQNIQQEMDSNELMAWQKLMRVLTHEIMNSVTPISSLARSAHDLIQADTPSDRESIQAALETIDRRSRGLLEFTQRFRTLTKTRLPEPSWAYLSPSVEHVLELYQDDLSDFALYLDLNHREEFHFDPKLLEQVIINLIKNGIEAQEAQADKALWISTYTKRGKAYLEVADNGPGIPDSDHEQVFIPFYSSKKGGSGIGLSLSRQIIRSMGGQLRLVESKKGARFQIIL